MSRFMDWFTIAMSPLVAIAVWFSDDLPWLRFCAFLWLINAVIEAACDRVKASAHTSPERNIP
jgi:hypothetical protein